jgi:hypothetical protein
MNEENYNLNPKKILMGKEAKKTNVFLQGVYNAATSGKDSAPYVKKVLNGDGGFEEKEHTNDENDEGL